MTLSIAELLFEDATLKNNQPLPETSSEDFTVNQAFLNSLKKTVSSKIFSKLPEAKLVKKAIDEIKSVDSQEDKDKIQKQVGPIINNPLGAFSKQDLMRIAISATNISRLGPVVFDVAQMKTGNEQVKGFTGIDLQLIKSTQIVPFLVMTKEGEVLSGENNRKGSFGYAFLAPAYYAKIEEKNVPVYEALFPGLLENNIVDGEESKFAANVENLELPVVPIDSEILKLVQQAFKNQKTLPALVEKLQTTYRSTMQNIVRDEEEKGDSPAERQSQEESNAGLIENNSLVYKQGISSLILENDASESDRLNVSNNGQKLNDMVVNANNLAEIRDEFFKFNRNLYKKEVYLLPENFDYLFNLAFKMDNSLFVCYIKSHFDGFKYMLDNFGFYDEDLNSKLKENIALAFKVDKLFQEKFDEAKKSGVDVTKDMFTNIEKGEALKFTGHFNKHIATHFSKIFATDDKRLVIELLEKAMKVPDKRGWQDVFRAGGSKDVAKLFKKLESYNKDSLAPDFIEFLMYVIKNKKKIKIEAKVHKNRIISEAANFSVDKGIIRSIWRHLSDIGLDKFADQIRRHMFWNVVDESAAKLFEKRLQDIDDQIQVQDQGEQGEGEEDQGEQGEGEEDQGEQGEGEGEEDQDFDDKFDAELDKALSKAKLEIEKYDDVQKVSKSNPRINEIRNWLRFIGQQKKVDAIYDRLTEIDPELADAIRGIGQDRATIKNKSFGDVEEILLINIASLYDLIVKGLKIEITPDAPFSNRIQRYAELQSLIDNNSYSAERKEGLEGIIKEDLEALFSKDSRFFFAEQIVNVIDSEETKKAFLSKTKEVKDKFINLFTRSLNSSTQDDTFKSVQKTPPYLVYLAKKLDMELREMFSKHLNKEQPQTIAMLMSCIQPVFGLEKVYNSLIAGYYDLPKETQVEVAVIYASLDTVDNNTLQEAIITLGNDIAKNKKLDIEITKEELDKFGEDCKVIYGVPVEEEEVKNEHINDICEYMQRKIIQESDRERYEKEVAKAEADFKAQYIKKSNAEGSGFIAGGFASLAIGIGLGISTGGLAAAVPLVASIIGCPFAAIGTGMVTGLLVSDHEKKKVTQSNLSGKIERKAKQSSKILKRIILNQVKAATVVENKYIHLKNNSLAKLIFEEADFDFTDSGTDVKRSSTKKRQIERKSLEAMFAQKKFLMYDKSLEETKLDVLGLKNEFIESLNSILDYYYNTTIVGVVSKKSAFETIKDVKIDNAISGSVESIGQEETIKAVVEAAAESARREKPDASDDEVQLSAAKVVKVFANNSFTDKRLKSMFSKLEEKGRPPIFAKIDNSGKIIPPEQTTSTVDKSNQTGTDNSEETVSAVGIIKTLDIYKEYDEFLQKNSYDRNSNTLGMENRSFIPRTPANIAELRFDSNNHELVFILGEVTVDEKYYLALIGVVYREILYYYDIENTKSILNLPINAEQKITEYLNEFITFKRYFLVIGDKSLSQDLIKKLKDDNKSKLASSVLAKMSDVSESRKESNDYVLGSLTNLLFESDLKRSKDFYNKSKNKKQELSNLREEWLNIWDIYK
jgi:hypothetical protein